MAIGSGTGVVNTGSFPKRMWPGVSAWYGDEYAAWAKLYPQIFDTIKSDKLWEEVVSMAGTGLGVSKAEGSPVSYASFRQGLTTRLVNTVYALGFIITHEAQADDQYATKLTEIGSRFLARSMLQLKETLGANILNNGFSASGSHIGGDSSTLFGTHTTISGSTNLNTPVAAADLSEAGLEQAIIDIQGFVTEEGLKMRATPTKLLVPRQLQFTAERILRSPLRSGTADNDINAIKHMGMLQEPALMSVFLTGSKAWFLKTDVANGLTLVEREGFMTAADNDFDTSNAKFKAMERYVFDWVDYRGVYGVSPA
jgi:hypothetical protein